MLGADPLGFVKDIGGLLQQSANPDDFVRLYTSPNDPSNLLMMRNITNTHVNVGYWPDDQLLSDIYDQNPFNEADIRTSNEYPVYVLGSNGRSLAKFEFLFERSSLTSNVGLNYTIVTALKGEEVLLNRAESYVYKNQLNLALADLQLYVSKRYENNPTITLPLLQTYYQANNNQLNTLFLILDERRKEFIHEGLRWFDIKRFGIRVQHQLEDGTTITLEQNDLRKVLQIPQAAIDVGGLEPNPR
jgi:hypothetical protein